MSKKNQGIEVYLRVRPTKKPFQGFEIEKDDNEVVFTFPKDGSKSGNQHQKDEKFAFNFNGILDMMAQQESVFNTIAKDVVESSFEGFNGTIFAYGQTGSGKTFTITGGAERYVDRGIIPRTISYIFNEISKRNTHTYKVNVSYLEIYNDYGYDLLDENHASKSLFDLPKVQMYENTEDQFVLKNLSVHRAENEEDALNLLFIGDTNRVVSETPKNDASTRSHCIFIIQLESQKIGDDVKTLSKLHLVDLSGSERVSQTGIDGKTLNEAKHINLSLHYLEQVIVCLNKKAKGEQLHIPYRNSMMTQVLRDSLGGNCKTKMIANISALQEDIYESLSTCRFAKRVSKIKNQISKNEQVDPGLIIQRLKKEVTELKAEISLLKGEEAKESLTSEDVDRCNKMVEEFIESTDPSKTIILSDRLMINQCFYHFKHIYKDMQKKKGNTNNAISADTSSQQQKNKNDIEDKNLQEEAQRLQLLVQQRDNEIAILLNYLNKKKGPNEQVPGVKVESIQQLESSQKQEESKTGNTLYQSMMNASQPKKEENNNYSIVQGDLNETPQQIKNTQDKELKQVQQLVNGPIKCYPEDLTDRTKAFDLFRRSYRKNEAMEENRQILKQKYARGKELGNDVNDTRNKIKQLTNKIEQIRKENALRGLVDSNGEILKTPEEQELQKEITHLKQQYSTQYAELKDLKAEIERIQNLLERCRVQMQKDFENWLSVMLKQQSQQIGQGNTTMRSNTDTLSQSTTSNFNGTSDKKVNENLQAFYKARDQIYNGIK